MLKSRKKQHNEQKRLKRTFILVGLYKKNTQVFRVDPFHFEASFFFFFFSAFFSSTLFVLISFSRAPAINLFQFFSGWGGRGGEETRTNREKREQSNAGSVSCQSESDL